MNSSAHNIAQHSDERPGQQNSGHSEQLADIPHLQPNYLSYFGLSADPFTLENNDYFSTEALDKLLRLMDYLSHYSDKVIVVTGAAGLGKTRLIDEFIAREDSEKAICRIEATAEDTATQLLYEIAEQWQLNLPQQMGIEVLQQELMSVAHEVDRDVDARLILIDDAHLLSRDVLAVLLELVHRPHNGTSQIRLLFFGEEPLRSRIEQLLAASEHPRPLFQQRLSPFDFDETGSFIQWLFEQTGETEKNPFTQSDYQVIYEVSGGHLSAILDAARAQMQQSVNRLLSGGQSANKQKPILWLLLPLLLVCAAGLAYLFLAMDDNAVVPVVADSEAGQVQAIERHQEEETQDAEVSPLEPDNTSLAGFEGPDSVSEPEEVSLETVDKTTDPTSQQPALESPAAEQLVLAENQVMESDQEDSIDTPAINEAEIESQAESFTAMEQHVLEFPAGNYTKQLFGSFQEAKLQELLAQVGDDTAAFYVETEHQGKPWFVLLYGNYASAAEANSIELPTALQSFSPWVRKWSGLQSAIKERTTAAN